MGGCCSSRHSADRTGDVTSPEKGKPDSNKIAAEAADMTFFNTLKEISLLSSLTDSSLRTLCSKFTEKSFLSGTNLMAQGDIGAEFFIIVSGKCKVILSNDNGSEVEISELNEGDYCGEQALLKDARRGATIRCCEDTKCLILDQSTFREVLSDKNNIHFANRDAKRNAISAEMMEQYKKDNDEEKKEDSEQDPNKIKDDDTIQWLLKSVDDNILFGHLDSAQKLIVVQEMYKKEVKKDEFIIKQGDEGNTFYVIATGKYVISITDVGEVDRFEVDSSSNGRCVGELALLYNAPRAASVQCIECENASSSIVWCVDRTAFRKALRDVHEKASNQNIEFLKKCELLKPCLSSELHLIDQALEITTFNKNDIIFNKGDEGDKFYIIKLGKVEGIISDSEDTFTLEPGSFFGERALLTNEPRAATIRVISDTLECLTLCREDFITLLGPLDDIMNRNMEEYKKGTQGKPMGQKKKKEEVVCKLAEFETIGILGRGAFGTVTLVKDPSTSTSYALKAIRKNQIIELGQQSHIINEKNVMEVMDNPFLVNLCATYRDEHRVYFLLEVCLGGELFTILRKNRSFDESTSKFYAACVIEAFDYMHSMDIIYRDLKPENLVMATNGYLKITDFGFAKICSNKTFTLCGTPDYLAPEIVTGQGHGKAVDWWTTGVLIYEMLSSFPPFFDDEPMMTYRKIIQGKFKFPRYLSSSAKDIISKFLKAKSTKRLGIIKGGTTLIKSHPWFKNFNWNDFKQQKLKPPIENKIKNESDLSNFDTYKEEKESLKYKDGIDKCLGWDKDF